jgi:hypothetical protein
MALDVDAIADVLVATIKAGLGGPRAEIERLRVRIDALERDNRELRARLDRLAPSAAIGDDDRPGGGRHDAPAADADRSTPIRQRCWTRPYAAIARPIVDGSNGAALATDPPSGPILLAIVMATEGIVSLRLDEVLAAVDA